MKEFGIKVLKKVRDLAIIAFVFIVVICILVGEVISKDPDTIAMAYKILRITLVSGLLVGLGYTVVSWNKH